MILYTPEPVDFSHDYPEENVVKKEEEEEEEEEKEEKILLVPRPPTTSKPPRSNYRRKRMNNVSIKLHLIFDVFLRSFSLPHATVINYNIQ